MKWVGSSSLFTWTTSQKKKKKIHFAEFTYPQGLASCGGYQC